MVTRVTCAWCSHHGTHAPAGQVTTATGTRRCRRCATCGHEATEQVEREARQLSEKNMKAGAALLRSNGFQQTSDGRWQLEEWGADERLTAFDAITVVLLNRQWAGSLGGYG